MRSIYLTSALLICGSMFLALSANLQAQEGDAAKVKALEMKWARLIPAEENRHSFFAACG
jgi:hypothetical protein